MCLDSKQKENSALSNENEEDRVTEADKNSFLSHALKPKVVCEWVYGEWNCRIIDVVGILPATR